MNPARSQRRGVRSAVLPMRAAAQGVEVAEHLEAQPHEAVERPDVDVLEAIPRPRGLGRDEPGDRHLRDVVVVAVDVRVRVVRDVVPHAPGVARDPEQRVRASSRADGCSASLRNEAPWFASCWTQKPVRTAPSTRPANEQRRQHVGRRAEQEQRPRDDDQADRDGRLRVQAEEGAPGGRGRQVGLDLAARLAHERAAALEGDALRGGLSCHSVRRALLEITRTRLRSEAPASDGSPAARRGRR